MQFQWKVVPGRYLDRKRAVTKACTVIAKQQMYHGGVSADITEANGRNVIMRHPAEEGGFLFICLRMQSVKSERFPCVAA